MAREHLLVVRWGGGGGGGGDREKLRDIPICFRRITFTTIKGGGRPTRLLPHAKILLIPIESFLSAGQIVLWKVLHLY